AYNPNEAIEVPVYGPPVSWTTTQTSPETTVTTVVTTISEPYPVPVYGPPISWTTTGTELTMPTTTATTNTIPEAVYGPPIAWYGDINMDGKVDVFDMIELRKAYINGEAGKGLDSLRADINQDGKIGMADLVMLENYLLGKIDNLDEPLPEPVPTTAEPQHSFINTTNTTPTEPIPQPEYGAPIAFK
ncbi:MAG: dockerin type I repeat-containing protein, partial [Ruminococcus sp.]|nr:dockerin type I repeat-containing protein [Ruminococcus sp.]